MGTLFGSQSDRATVATSPIRPNPGLAEPDSTPAVRTTILSSQEETVLDRIGGDDLPPAPGTSGQTDAVQTVPASPAASGDPHTDFAAPGTAGLPASPPPAPSQASSTPSQTPSPKPDAFSVTPMERFAESADSEAARRERDRMVHQESHRDLREPPRSMGDESSLLDESEVSSVVDPDAADEVAATELSFSPPNATADDPTRVTISSPEGHSEVELIGQPPAGGGNGAAPERRDEPKAAPISPPLPPSKSSGLSASASPLSPAIGRRKRTGPTLETVGRYEVVRQIASGAFGFVYEGRDPDLDRTVAIKVARSEVARYEPLRRLFRQEAHQAGRLDHPGIVPIYELGITDSRDDPEQQTRPYIVMGFCHGQTLDAWMKEQHRSSQHHLSPALAAALLRKIAEAVGHGHREGVVHRDLKPGNVMVLDDGPAASTDGLPTLRVMDFGLSGDLSSLNQPDGSRLIAGSAAYMAPEQADGESASEPADVHALGAMLFKMLTGKTPYSEGDGRTRLLSRLTSTTARSPRQLDPSIPVDLASICLKCLRKNPSERYADANELAADLTRFLDGESVEARSHTVTDRLTRWASQGSRIREVGAVLLGVHLFLPVWSTIAQIGLFVIMQSGGLAEFARMMEYLVLLTWPMHGYFVATAWRMFHGRPVRGMMWGALAIAVLFFAWHTTRAFGLLPPPSPYYVQNPGVRWQIFSMLSLTSFVDLAGLSIALLALRRSESRAEQMKLA